MTAARGTRGCSREVDAHNALRATVERRARRVIVVDDDDDGPLRGRGPVRPGQAPLAYVLRLVALAGFTVATFAALICMVVLSESWAQIAAGAFLAACAAVVILVLRGGQ